METVFYAGANIDRRMEDIVTDNFDTYPIFIERPGVSRLTHKRRPAEEARISVIVELAKRHDKLFAAGNY